MGCKYGLARGIPYSELSEEEKRGRKHKNKVVLEAERQAMAALDKVGKYAELAIIDQKELTIPLLNVKAPVQEAMKIVEKELGIPVPTMMGQKAWREERTANINAAIKALVEAIYEACNKQNEGIKASASRVYIYYMQNLNRLIKENEALLAENNALKAENAKVKERISQLDENAVKRVAAQKDEVIDGLRKQLATANSNLASLGNDYNALLSDYKYLLIQWNDLKQQPEIVEAIERVDKRQKHEAAIKREEQARQSRYEGIINRFIDEGHGSLGKFSKTERINFNKEEANAIYYGIVATAVKHGLSLNNSNGIVSSVDKFLSGMTWNGCTDFRIECVSNWTKLFATKDVVYTDSIVNNFLAFVDHMSCSADTYVSLGGSNGCADQLTNWDGTQKIGLGAMPRKKFKRI